MPDTHATILIDNGSEHRWPVETKQRIESLAYGGTGEPGFCTTGHETETEGEETIDDWQWVRFAPTTPDELWEALGIASAIHAADAGATISVVVERTDKSVRSYLGTEKHHDSLIAQATVDRGLVTGHMADAVRQAKRILAAVEGIEP